MNTNTDTHPPRNVICPRGAWIENTPANAIYPHRAEPEACNGAVGWTSAVTNEIFFLIHGRHLSGRVHCSHRATAVSNLVTGPLPTISIMRPGNPNYEFKLRCHLLGNLSIRSSPFRQQWFQITRNCKIIYCINNSGIWKPTRQLPSKNN